MPTIKQREAFKEMVENGGNVSRAMINVGYSKQTAKSPHKLTNSIGYRQLLDEYGLTESLIALALVDDIKAKPGNRKPELELAAKLKGMIVDRKDITTAGEKLESVSDLLKSLNSSKVVDITNTSQETPQLDSGGTPGIEEEE